VLFLTLKEQHLCKNYENKKKQILKYFYSNNIIITLIQDKLKLQLFKKKTILLFFLYFKIRFKDLCLGLEATWLQIFVQVNNKLKWNVQKSMYI